MKIVYIAGPFRASSPWLIEQNVRSAEQAGLMVATRGMIPLIPHSMYRFFQESLPDTFWIPATGELLKKCDAMLLTGAWECSSGCQGEIRIADSLFIPCFTTLQSLVEWNRSS